MVTQVHRCWPRFTDGDPGSSMLTQVHRWWPRFIELTQVYHWWPRYTDGDPGSSMLTQVHRWWPRYTDGDPGLPLVTQIHRWWPRFIDADPGLPLVTQIHRWWPRFIELTQVHRGKQLLNTSSCCAPLSFTLLWCDAFYLRGASDARVLAIIVCLSRTGIVSKWLNVGSNEQRHVIAQGL